ncbi:MAG: hypothetical protein AB1640_10185 [bacterium]
MIGHPLLLAVALTDALALLLLAAAFVSAIRTLSVREPGSALAHEGWLERASGIASVEGRAAIWLLLMSTALLVVAIAIVLRRVVPGAMCGTGVLQASQGAGERALALRGLALGLLGAWHLMDRFRRHGREPLLAAPAARSLLVAFPVAVPAVIATFRALAAMDRRQPVSCCAAVYGQVRSAPGTAATGGVADGVWMAIFAAGTLLLFLLASLAVSRRSAGREKLAAAMAIASAGWAAVAAVALVRVLSAYYFASPDHHHCTWCLFLPGQKAIGFPLFVLLSVVALEGPAAWISARVARRFPAVAAEAVGRSRQAGWHVMAAAALFVLLTGLPALLWRLRFGTWIGGGCP